jgi:hypothetical protein
VVRLHRNKNGDRGRHQGLGSLTKPRPGPGPESDGQPEPRIVDCTAWGLVPRGSGRLLENYASRVLNRLLCSAS